VERPTYKLKQSSNFHVAQIWNLLFLKKYAVTNKNFPYSTTLASLNLALLEVPQPDPTILLQLIKTPMPFGKYKGTLLCDLPVFYLEWFARKGFPTGKLGVMLETIFVIKSNGLEQLLAPLKKGIK